MLKVVFDTNVFISAIVFGGTPRKIIDAWLAKQYIFCLSPELKAEILIKLEKKFSLPQEAKADYLVSGDKLVLALKDYNNTKIISPREFFDQLSA